MTDLRTLIAQCREIEKAATPGPWEDLPSEHHNHRSFVTGFPTVGCRVVAECSAQDSPQVDRDAALIATARNLFAALLDVAEAAIHISESFDLEHGLRCELLDNSPGCKESKDRICTCGVWEATTQIEAAEDRLREAMEANRG